jgi:hypothetical protein
MSSTLGQSSLNFSNVLSENTNTTKPLDEDALRLMQEHQKQLLIKNINEFPRNELEEYLKVNHLF